MHAGSALPTVAGAMAGAMLALAGAAKLPGGAAGLEAFLREVGLRARTAAVLRRALPWLELLVGVWLLSLRWAGVLAPALAGGLALGFAGALVLAMRRGVGRPCRCFGALDRSPAHGLSLLRALLLAGAALLALVASPGGGGAGAGGAEAWGLGVVLALCSVVAFALAGETLAFRAGVRHALASGAGERSRGGVP